MQNGARMKDDIARVPALLLCGGSNDDRDAAIARLAEPVADGRSIAVLRGGSGMFANPPAPLGPHVVVKRMANGCACCTAGVMFRVALFELLRAGPARLVVDLGPGAPVETLEAQLQGGSLARALRVVGRVDLDAAPAAHSLTWPAGT